MRQGAMHDYARRVLRAFERGVLERGEVGDVRVIHDDDCGVFTGGLCECDCDIRVTCIDREGRAKSFLIGNDGELVSPNAN